MKSKTSSAGSRHSANGEIHKSRTMTCGKENFVPLARDYDNAMIAKTLAKENLIHQPLPDNFDDNLYKLSKTHVDENECNTTAIGCKGYGVPGPTQCSKLKVYRPKTTNGVGREHIKSPVNDTCIKDGLRPTKRECYSEIDYALCWDLCPPSPSEDFKRPTHIDGSNGSLAPAVFTLVPSREPSPMPHENKRDGLHSPLPLPAKENSAKNAPKVEQRLSRRDIVELPNPVSTVNPSAVMTIVKRPVPQEDIFMSYKNNRELPKINERQRCHSCSSRGSHHNTKGERSSKNGNPMPAQNTVHNLNNGELKNGNPTTTHNAINNSNNSDVRPVDDVETRLKQRNCQSSNPNIISHGTNLGKNILNADKNRNNGHNNHYNNNKGDVKELEECSRLRRSRESSISSNSKNRFSPPKLKNHVNKKNYAIPTLLPPFTLWPGTTGQDYPEHWRLASVYQHSYKPIEMRKRNLLQCIYN